MQSSAAVAGLASRAQAVIFDFDGVVVDSEPLKAAAYEATFREVFGVALDPSHRGWRGLPEREVIAFWTRSLGLGGPIDAAALIESKRRHYRSLLDSPRLRLVPGVLDFIRALHGRGTPLALATTSTRVDQERIFARFGLAPYFRVVATQEDVERPKPDPQMYHLVLSRLGVPAGRGLAFEDSPAGVRAACGAGLETVCVLTSYRREDFPPGLPAVTDFAALAALVPAQGETDRIPA